METSKLQASCYARVDDNTYVHVDRWFNEKERKHSLSLVVVENGKATLTRLLGPMATWTPDALSEQAPETLKPILRTLLTYVRSDPSPTDDVLAVDLTEWEIKCYSSSGAAVIQHSERAVVLRDPASMQGKPVQDLKLWIENAFSTSPYNFPPPRFNPKTVTRLKQQLDNLQFDEDGNCIGPDSEA